LPTNVIFTLLHPVNRFMAAAVRV